MVNSPDNPCGGVFAREELEALADLAARHDLIVISDEIYEEFIYEGEKPPSIAAVRPEMKERTVLINGVSKSYAMTGMAYWLFSLPQEIGDGDFQLAEPRQGIPTA